MSHYALLFGVFLPPMLANVVLEPESSRAGGDGEQIQEGLGGGMPTWDRWGKSSGEIHPRVPAEISACSSLPYGLALSWDPVLSIPPSQKLLILLRLLNGLENCKLWESGMGNSLFSSSWQGKEQGLN